jgi:hypothetical protein
MMEAVRASETSVYFNEAKRRYVAEGCHHQVLNVVVLVTLLAKIYLYYAIHFRLYLISCER